MDILRNSILFSAAAMLLWQFMRARRTVAQIKAQAYRPERHYMRGPGPKYHAKYGR